MTTRIPGLFKLIRAAALCCIILAFRLSGATASSTGSLDAINPNDTFLATFVVANPVPVTIQTYGYGGSANAPGGKNACPPAATAPSCHDSKLTVVLPAGSYTLALTTFENFSFAENYGTGFLGDGFIGLGTYFDPDSAADRTSDYAVDIRIPALVSGQVSTTQNGFGRNRSTSIWVATLTVTNTSSAPIAGPIQVVLSNLTAGVTMTNNTGVFVYPFIRYRQTRWRRAHP